MVIRHQQVFDVILIQRLHALDALAAAVLTLEVVHAHALDVAEIRHGDHGRLIRNQILHGKFAFLIVVADLCAAVIAVLLADDQDLLLDDKEELLLIGQDSLQLSNTQLQFLILVLQLLAFQTGQCAQTHIYNRLCLCVT